ncbi:hypothetical protein GWK47_054273 [Chionoecetes opilio]|uniref:Uncharacterized protein n=1 Tax=Chionoecetes opilio TaxID=41210 RepID=A0A8J5CQR9_CHIOP|nr:hypothetical protein GWK47_054273 [Chionoecetes opilio]
MVLVVCCDEPEWLRGGYPKEKRAIFRRWFILRTEIGQITRAPGARGLQHHPDETRHAPPKSALGHSKLQHDAYMKAWVSNEDRTEEDWKKTPWWERAQNLLLGHILGGAPGSPSFALKRKRLSRSRVIKTLCPGVLRTAT